MNRIVELLIVVVAPLGLLAIGAGTVSLFFLSWRRNITFEARQNPLTRSLLRSPGHTLRFRLDELNEDITALLVAWIVLPLIIGTIHLSQSSVLDMPEAPHRFVFEVIVYLIGSWLIWHFVKPKLADFRKLRLGLEGELATGQELDQLMLHGCRVFHDIKFRYGNIDHVVVSRSGVFSVDTKMRGKPKTCDGSSEIVIDHIRNIIHFPDFTWEIPNKGLETQANWLSKYLSDVMGERIVAEPILALPGWFIKERIGRGKVFVINPINAAKFFVNSRNALTQRQVSQIAHHLDKLCRDVQPSFRENTSWES